MTIKYMTVLEKSQPFRWNYLYGPIEAQSQHQKSKFKETDHSICISEGKFSICKERRPIVTLEIQTNVVNDSKNIVKIK